MLNNNINRKLRGPRSHAPREAAAVPLWPYSVQPKFICAQGFLTTSFEPNSKLTRQVPIKFESTIYERNKKVPINQVDQLDS